MRLEVPPAPFYPGSEFFVGYDIPLRVIHVEQSPPFPPHRHDFTEFVVAYSGGGRHLVDGVGHAMVPGDVFLIARGVSHEFADPRDLCYINVIFDERVLFGDSAYPAGPDGFSRRVRAGDRQESAHFRLSVFGTREVVTVINRIDQELFQKKDGYAFMAEAYFMQLWGTLARKYAERDEGGESSASRVGRVVDLLTRDPSVEISVADMAAEAGTCVRNFHRAFKKLTGLPPLAYVNESRIRRACELLRDTDKTVAQIAALVGYDDSNYFARQFRHFVGCSPRQYRGGEKHEE
jgi:AraC-like DNA-binding protein/mannose-6-phosphate isomerase-like protein (cupin superfamily)